MNASVVLGQLLGMRSQLEGLIAALSEELEQPAVTCLHPMEDRRPIGSMGNVTGFKCLRCEHVVESKEQPNPVP